MIPVRLVLKDFLSYGSPEPLDFTGFDVACLSGQNGVGKSALLDAITWSVWACARGCEGGINQERLIRDGCEDMTVDFTFDLGGARYRIVRKRSKKAGKSEVQFLVADGEGWKNIAGESLKETDAKIESVLRMDYRTFTASAFFLQGRSDDFLARMKPDERKDVFARLLDLGTYEKLEDAARDHARDAERDRKDFAARAETLATTLPDAAAIEATITELDASMREVDTRAAAAAKGLEEQRAALSVLQVADATLRAERDALAMIERSAAETGAQQDQQRRELLELDALLSRTAEVNAAVAEREELAKQDVELRERQERAAALEANRAELTAAIEGERRTITGRIADTAARIAVVDAEIAALGQARSELQALEESIASSEDVAAALQEARNEASSLAEDGARLKEQIAQVASSIDKSRRALDVLSEGAETGAAECPVCGTALDDTHRAKVKGDIEREIAAAAEAGERANAELEDARKEAIRCREEIARLEQATAERERLVASREAVLARLERSDVIAAERETLGATLAADELLISDGSFAADARERLSVVAAELDGLYDAAAHAAVRRRLDALADYPALAGRIEQAALVRTRLEADIDASVARIADLGAQAEARGSAIAELAEQAAGLPDARRAVTEADAALDDLRRLAADAAAEQARLHERLVAAKQGATELEEVRKAEREAADANRRYSRLREAFGPSGIPKLIIDNALPELTDDANRILGRLSDHEMSIQFVLERATKAGKAKETFDVLVQHDGGVRDFAMFSGGEAFRVAFAVRLAMSKLLVRRSGARLETLVIDEGFGTQDPEGREKLVEAINLAREEFAKVLVITHLDELKDQFGTQIRVEKGISGSCVALQGS